MVLMSVVHNVTLISEGHSCANSNHRHPALVFASSSTPITEKLNPCMYHTWS